MSAVENVQDKVKQTLKQLDVQLSQCKVLNDLENRTHVPKTYVVLGGGFVVFVMIFFNLAAQLLTNAISWLYPAYASFKAIESTTSSDDKQWLTYWTVIGFVQMTEYFSDILLYWFPFYYLFKTILVAWLVLPQFRGAEVLYDRALRPFLLTAQTQIDSRVNHFSGSSTATSSDESARKTD